MAQLFDALPSKMQRTEQKVDKHLESTSICLSIELIYIFLFTGNTLFFRSVLPFIKLLVLMNST